MYWANCTRMFKAWCIENLSVDFGEHKPNATYAPENEGGNSALISEVHCIG